MFDFFYKLDWWINHIYILLTKCNGNGKKKKKKKKKTTTKKKNPGQNLFKNKFKQIVKVLLQFCLKIIHKWNKFCEFHVTNSAHIHKHFQVLRFQGVIITAGMDQKQIALLVRSTCINNLSHLSHD